MGASHDNQVKSRALAEKQARREQLQEKRDGGEPRVVIRPDLRKRSREAAERQHRKSALSR